MKEFLLKAPGAFENLTAAEHGLIGSSNTLGTPMYKIQRRLLDTQTQEPERSESRRVALIPIALLHALLPDNGGIITDELYQQVVEARRDAYLEGAAVIFDGRTTDNGEFVMHRLILSADVDRQEGTVPNSIQVQAFLDKFDGSEEMAPITELDGLTVNKDYEHLFELRPRQKDQDFRVLRIIE